MARKLVGGFSAVKRLGKVSAIKSAPDRHRAPVFLSQRSIPVRTQRTPKKKGRVRQTRPSIFGAITGP